MISPKWKLLFLFCWLLCSWQLGFFQQMKKGPFGVHQGAQADRACIALNYYTDNMNLFHPRVNETRGETGIVGCELPLVNYTAAISYKIFGFNDSYYRIIMWVIMSFGLFAAFLSFSLFLKSKWLALILSFTWYFSPILAYYTPNFIPDTASMSLNLIGLYFFLRYYKAEPKNKNITLATLFMTLAGLIKITSLILPISITGVVIFSLILKKKEWLNITFPRFPLKWILGIGIGFLIIFSWYKYSAYLNVKHNTSLFFLEGKWAKSLAEFKECLHIFTANWLNLIYPKIVLIAILTLYFICLAKYFKRNHVLAFLSIFYILGSVAFFVLMVEQYRYHDYYIICLLPLFLLALLFISSSLQSSELRAIPKFGLILALLILMSLSYIKTRENLKSRYTPGDYWEQSFFYESDFKEVEQIKKKFNITRKEEIFVAYDLNPNVVLYFLNLKGYKIAPDFTEEHLVNMYHRAKPRILVVNDPVYMEKQHPKSLNIQFTEIAKTGNMTFYELDYSKMGK